MSMENADEVIVSEVPDISDLPLDAEVNLGSVEYIRIMRRIGIDEDVTTVSAFNSSI